MSELLTVRDVAQVMKCSEDKVIRVFATMEGVIDLGRPENLSRRRYRVLRIPKQIVERYLSTKAGRSIQIEVPERAERRRRSPRWDACAILNLAKPGLQNGLRLDDAAQIEVPERAERRRRSPQWEAHAILNLAKAGLQNGLRPGDADDEKIYRRVAERARLLTFVPRNRWHEVVWYDEGE